MRASSLPTIRPPCLSSSIVTNNTPNKTLCATSHGYFARQVLFSMLQNVLKYCNIPYSKNNMESLCTAICQMGKHYKISFQPSVTKYKQPLDLVHADLWGPAPCLSSRGFKYYICFMDHATRSHGCIHFI